MLWHRGLRGWRIGHGSVEGKHRGLPLRGGRRWDDGFSYDLGGCPGWFDDDCWRSWQTVRSGVWAKSMYQHPIALSVAGLVTHTTSSTTRPKSSQISAVATGTATMSLAGRWGRITEIAARMVAPVA